MVDPSPTCFSGTDGNDVKRFFFISENDFAREIKEEEKPFKLLEVLEGDALNIFYEKFAVNGSLTEDGGKYDVTQEAFVNKYRVESN